MANPVHIVFSAKKIAGYLKDQRGELATVVALIGLGVITAGVFIASRLAQTGPGDISRASGISKIYPIEDTYVNANNTTAVYCNDKLHSDGSPINISYVKFDLRNFSQVTSARVYFKISEASAQTMRIKSVSSTSWRECSVNYGNRPTLGSQIASLPGGASGAWKSADITSYVNNKKGQLMTIAIDSNQADGVSYFSSEVGDKPYIEINGSSGTVPSKTPTKVPSRTPTKVPSRTPTKVPVNPTVPNPTITAVGLISPTFVPLHIVNKKMLPMDDTFVRKAVPTQNYCTNSPLQVDGDAVAITYMKFDLRSVSAINSAKLWIRVSNPSAGTQRLLSVSNDSWNGCGINYNNRPTAGSQFAVISGAASGTWKSIDVTNKTRSELGSIMSFAIDSTHADGLDFYSKENTTYAPYLEIAETEGTIPTTGVTIIPTNPVNTPTKTPTPVATIVPTQITASIPPEPTLSLEQVAVAFTPSELSIPPASQMKIMMNAQARSVGFAKVFFQFDPSLVKLTSEITTNPTYTNIIERTSMEEANSTGLVKLIIAANPSDTPLSGVFEFARFTIDSATDLSNYNGDLYFNSLDSQIVDAAGPEISALYTNAGVTVNSAAGACTRGDSGNLDCSTDGCIDTSDFELFRQDFGKSTSELNISDGRRSPDLVADSTNMIDTADYEIFRSNFGTCNP